MGPEAAYFLENAIAFFSTHPYLFAFMVVATIFFVLMAIVRKDLSDKAASNHFHERDIYND